MLLEAALPPLAIPAPLFGVPAAIGALPGCISLFCEPLGLAPVCVPVVLLPGVTPPVDELAGF
jgi:hypothetical protein